MIRLDDSLPDLERPDLVAPNPLVESLKPICVGRQTACGLLSVSSRTLDKLIGQGLPVIRSLGKDLFVVSELERWAKEQQESRGE